MTVRADRLYQLLPAIYRARDEDQGFALRDFLRVLAAQANVVEEDISRLYDNWFVETCDDWVVPYLADLLGYSPLPEAALLDGSEPALGRALSPRSDVAHTIDARRRKGTLSLLEDLARDAAGWPGRAVEFRRQLGSTQHLDHQHAGRGATVDLRRPGALQLLRFARGAFDPWAHRVDVRRLGSQRRPGRFNIPDVGIFAFRLRTYPVTATPAYCVEENGPQCYTFSVLGHDTALFQLPVAEPSPTHIAHEANLPVPLRRYRFALRGDAADYSRVSPELYGEGKSVQVFAPDWPSKGQGMPVPIDALIAANLDNWKYQVPRNHLALDPETGRLQFPANQRPKRGVWTSYHYGFAGDIGGGEYARPLVSLDAASLYVVHSATPLLPLADPLPGNHFASIKDALAAWAIAKAATPSLRALVIELAESGLYDGGLDIQLDAGEAIQIRAAERTRPVLRLLDVHASRPDALSVGGMAGSRFILDGLLVMGRGVEVHGPQDDDPGATPGDLCELVIRHCTLVPGWSLHCDCDPKRPGEPSITLDATTASLRVENSILGPVSVVSPSRRTEPVNISFCNSILDATGVDRIALGAPDEAVAHASVAFSRCTVIGQVQAHALVLAEDCIFGSVVRVLRRQLGCMRFCFVPTGSRTPQRFHCQPDLALAGAPAAAKAATLLRVVPPFRSVRYGSPNYMRLDDSCCREIIEGASDGASMGAWHDLFEPQRQANLAARLGESVPAGADAGIIFAS
jgi:hypothetical protein